MENSEIMQRLLQEDKPSKPAKVEQTNAKSLDGENSISRIRVVTAKYKVYIVLLLICIALLLVKYIPATNNAYKASQSAYNQAKAQLSSIEGLIEVAKTDMSYLCDSENGVIKNEEALKKCLNEREGCSSLPETWKTGTEDDLRYDLSIPLSYLQLHSLYNERMPVDEKMVLKNLNEYLIKQDIGGGTKTKVGDIIRISIGDPETIADEHFFKVPVSVTIEFEDIDSLTGFLYNVEKKLIDKGDDRILYKIQSVSYDILSNDEPQITDISMVAYYYHDERFNDKTECEDESDNTTANDGESDDTTTNGDESDNATTSNDEANDTATNDDEANDTATNDDEANDTATNDDEANDTATNEDKSDNAGKNNDKSDNVEKNNDQDAKEHDNSDSL